MKILFVASEGAPFIKTGGLGDVIGSLPKALKNIGLDVRVILPKYTTIASEFREKMEHLGEINVPLGWRVQTAMISQLEYEGVIYYFVDNQYYFDRPNAYSYFDDSERFAFFSRAVLEAIPHLGFNPQIIHCHDWQTGLVPIFLKRFYRENLGYQGISTIYTIHNLKYQGIYPKEILEELLGLEKEDFTVDKLEFHNQVNYMKAGIVFADHITTVSQTYAHEIKHPFFGEGMEGLLKDKEYKLSGIINGIDVQEYNPQTDPHIFENYTTGGEVKLFNKVSLQEHLSLQVDKEIPVLGLVSRLVHQKGLDLLECMIEQLLVLDIQIAILGCGEERYESLLKQKAKDYPHKLSANISFNEAAARKIYAGSDFFLMPSLYEPCGLSQLIALRYGTIPIVRETGGLKDTIQPFNEYTGEGNGLSFTNYNAHDFLYTIQYGVEIYKQKNLWSKLVKNALEADYSWNKSALEYKTLYQNVFKAKEGAK